MVRFDWNGLRIDEHVVVHDRGGIPLVAGIVRTVERRRRFNLIGVTAPGGSAPVLWPTPEQVHLDPRPVDEPVCWRCVAGAVGEGARP